MKPSRAIGTGVAAGIGTFVGLGFVSMGFYASVGGLLIAGIVSLIVTLVVAAVATYLFKGEATAHARNRSV